MVAQVPAQIAAKGTQASAKAAEGAAKTAKAGGKAAGKTAKGGLKAAKAGTKSAGKASRAGAKGANRTARGTRAAGNRAGKTGARKGLTGARGKGKGVGGVQPRTAKGKLAKRVGQGIKDKGQEAASSVQSAPDRLGNTADRNLQQAASRGRSAARGGAAQAGQAGQNGEGNGELSAGGDASKAAVGAAVVAAAKGAQYAIRAGQLAVKNTRRAIKWANRFIPLPLKWVIYTVLALTLLIGGLATLGSEIIDEQADMEMAGLAGACGGVVDPPIFTGGPGTPGYPGTPELGALTAQQVAAVADYGLRYVGVSNPTAAQIQLATAIARGESSWNPRKRNPVPPDDSYGLWQINMLGSLGPDRRARYNIESDAELYSPKINAIAMGIISNGGTNWQPWTVYTKGTYQQWMTEVQPVASEVASMSDQEVDSIVNQVDSTEPPNIPPLDSPPDGDGGGTGGGGTVTVAGCGVSGTNIAFGAECPAGFPPRGGQDPYPSNSAEEHDHSMSTPATRTMRDAVLQCFGRGTHFDCYDPRDGTFEHPRGRACDFGIVPIGSRRASGSDKAFGDAMAEWVIANAEELNVIQVLWYGEMWMGGSRSRLSAQSITQGHYDHVHVSVATMPGDPDHAYCNGRAKCNP